MENNPEDERQQRKLTNSFIATFVILSLWLVVIAAMVVTVKSQPK